MKRCGLCNEPVQWMSTKFGKRMLFDLMPVPVAMDTEQEGRIPGRWPVSRTATRMLLAPVAHYSREKRSRIKHVVLLHKCVIIQQATA